MTFDHYNDSRLGFLIIFFNPYSMLTTVSGFITPIMKMFKSYNNFSKKKHFESVKNPEKKSASRERKKYSAEKKTQLERSLLFFIKIVDQKKSLRYSFFNTY